MRTANGVQYATRNTQHATRRTPGPSDEGPVSNIQLNIELQLQLGAPTPTAIALEES
jgi:hypothetical protein